MEEKKRMKNRFMAGNIWQIIEKDFLFKQKPRPTTIKTTTVQARKSFKTIC